jgi:hypothetical protein
MKNGWKQGIRRNGGQIAGIALALSMTGVAVGQGAPQPKGGMDTATTDTHGKFYCNIKALTPKERARHKELTEKLMTSRDETVETAKGFEFQYSPEKVSIAEVGEWVVAESKCCPFFDFHIDLENEGTLICLRLTGSDGIKAFIKSEFQLVPEGGR